MPIDGRREGRSPEGLDELYRATRRIGLRDSLDDLVEAVIDRAQRLIGFEHCALMLYEPRRETLTVHRARGYGDRRREILGLELELGEGISGRAAERREPVRVGDVRQDPNYVQGLAEARSNLAVPLLAGGELAGVINVESERRDAFTEEHEKQLTVLSAQAALAILASQARSHLHRRIVQLDALYRISRLASEGHDVDQILHRVLEVTEEVLPGASIALLLVEDGELRIRASRGYREAAGELTIPFGEGITGRCAAEGRPVIVDRVEEFEDYIEGIPGGRSEIAVPLQVEGEVIGVLNAESTEASAFGEEEKQTLMVVAQQVAAVIHTLRLHEETRQLAVTDSLTGLHNRRYFMERLGEHLDRAQRYQEELALVLLDCDQFKEINDRHGHPWGDRTLEAIGELLRDVLRSTDELARIGGDEFAALHLNATPDLVRGITRRIRSGAKEIRLDPSGSDEFRLTLSMGVAFYPRDASDAQSFLKRADEALYRAKSQGRDRVAFYGEMEPRPEDDGTE